MAQHTGRQYDDDLTVGADEYSESFSTDYVDLFEPLGDDDAPIARLKTINLSIDWEITDDILHQLNDELQDLKDVWAGNKINLIYVQALEKIGRYISVEKANSHPNAIKLLLTFYYNLEKIVSSPTMSEEEKKQLLLLDVKRFDQFKVQIAPSKEMRGPAVRSVTSEPQPVATAEETLVPSVREHKNVLTNLKAIVLGIDWEISDQELVSLSEEINKLEKIFSESRAKLIFLQGISALGSYIRSAKSSAHPDAFKLFRSFYEGLERIYTEVLTKDQEKAVLLAEVKKFNAFKAVIATTSSAMVVPADDSVSAEKETDEEKGGVIAPAFSDMPDDVRGFREEGEARSDINKRVASFLGEQEEAESQVGDEVGSATESVPGGLEVDSRLDSLFGDEEEAVSTAEASDLALAGVDVETEADDDSDERALPLQGGRLAPALAEISGQDQGMAELSVAESLLEDFSGAESVIPGVDVETEADDESDEPVLPATQEGVAPALVFTEEEYGFREAEFAGDLDEGESDLEDRLDSFFGAEIEESLQGRTPPVSGDASPELPSAVTAPTGISLTENKDRETALFADETEAGPALLSESFHLEREEEELDTTLIDRLFDEAGPEEIPAAVVSASQEVVFEPVGDDVEVDELPAERVGATDSEMALGKEAVARLRRSLASILAQQYESAFPLFFVEIHSLRQERQTEYVATIFLQLLETVGRHIDTCRGRTDIESLTVLQSLDNNIERMFQRKTGRNEEREQVLVEETEKVLLWQQGLISSLVTASKGEQKVRYS